MEADSAGLSMAVVALFKNGTVALEFAEEESWTTFPPITYVVNEGWQWDDIERIGIVVFNERQDSSGKFRIRISDTYTTNIPIDNENPITTELKQNYPNPFNPSTTISFNLPQASEVTLKVYNMLGQEVVTLLNSRMSSGIQTIKFDASNLASGMYIYRLQAGSNIQTKKMMLIK
jgi:hypothetical protein